MAKASTQIKVQKGELDVEAATKRLLTLSNTNLQKRCSGTETTSAAQLEKTKHNYDGMAGYREDVEDEERDGSATSNLGRRENIISPVGT